MNSSAGGTELRLARPEADTPRNAMRVLGPSATLGTAGLLLALAAVAWYVTWRETRGMMASGLTAPLFMAMWLTMMVAMMLPAIAPMVLAHRMVVLKRGEGSFPTFAFVAGYLTIWFVIGLLPLAGLLGFQALGPQLVGSQWLVVAAGAALVLAGLYQLTSLKSACLRACRTPVGFILTHDFGGGSRSAFKAGASHGLYCLGCCWSLMAVLVIVGLTSLAWMAVVAVVILVEKNWRHGLLVSRVAGFAVVALGLAVIAFPGLLTWLSGVGMPSSGV